MKEQALAGSTAVVTGAGAGIGRVISLRLAAAGAFVFAADLGLEAAAETVQLIETTGGDAQALRVDVSQAGSVAAAYEEVQRVRGRLDIQVSNAGITDRMELLELRIEDFDRVMRVNLHGTVLCGQAAARLMVAGKRGGRIVNISSVSGQVGGKGRLGYGASKAAIINVTQTMALELAPHDILVNAVAPGPTQVERVKHGTNQRTAFLARMALKRYARPEEIADSVCFLCSPAASFITGHVLNVDGGFMASGVQYAPDTNGAA